MRPAARILICLALFLISQPAQAQRILNSGSGVPPTLSGITGTITAGDPAGTAVTTVTVSGLSGGAWSLSPATYFSINSGSGAIVTTSTPTSAGTYTPTVTYTKTSGGQTIAVSAATSIVATTPAYTPSLDFSDARNSMYL